VEAFFVMLPFVVGIGGGVFLAYAGLMAKQRRRELLHVERMRSLELGKELPPIPIEEPVGDAYGNLKAAIILLFLGFAFLLGAGATEEKEMAVPAVICGSLGFAFLLIHWIVPKAAGKRTTPASSSVSGVIVRDVSPPAE